MESLRITYLSHSGFTAQVGGTLLVFDDAQPLQERTGGIAQGHVTREHVMQFENVLFFVSHAHADHYNDAIFSFSDLPQVRYVLGLPVPDGREACSMRKGDDLSLAGVEISALGSTDEGVSFLVRLAGWTIFHAGDLNFWHWREESTFKQIAQAESDFHAEVAPLIGKKIDFAFFPLDPRMGEMYDAGAQYFLMEVRPRVMIPMHWWGRAEAALEFARRNRSKYTEILALTRPGESLVATMGENGEISVEL
ncbi:MAG TPA: MBL fold metallo-hydrolase [Candidatus Aphodomonas merdavium]|nr:MBL fold metallo-hydrolase [Candidatus Aphodomonas merdavium]